MKRFLIFHGISAKTCKVIPLNVRGIGNFKKRTMIFTWCRKQKGVLFSYKKLPQKKTHGGCNSCGVEILVKKGVDFTVHSKIHDILYQYIY